MVNLLFYFHIMLYLEEVASYEKPSRNLTFEVKIASEISAFQ